MRVLFALSAAALVLGVAGSGLAAPAETTASAEALVAARQAAFRLNLGNFLAMKAAIARGDDVKTLALPSGAIAGWARALPGLFPAGSTTPKSAALSTIWSDRAGFEAAAAAMATEAAKLNALAKAGDTAGVAAQYTVLGGTCAACHNKYKAEEKR